MKGNEKELDPPKHPHSPSNEENDNQNSDIPERQLNDKHEVEIIWNISFDGSCRKTNSGASVWIHNTNEGHSYGLEFQCPNNIAEYEALLLGLHVLKNLGAKKISAQGDSKLVIKNIKGEESAKTPRLREYRNVALDILKTFEKYELI